MKNNNQFTKPGKFYNLKILFPDIASEWHPTRNKSLKPSEVFPNTKQKVWWQCENGHEWIAKIANRNNGKGCPFCSERTYIYKKYNNEN